jgi:hypothetical protein
MDDIETKILKSLRSDKFKARTITGIAKEVHVTPKVVINKLNSSPALNQQVKIYPRKSKDGRILVTTRDKFDSSASIKDKFIEAFATKRLRIEDEY